MPPREPADAVVPEMAILEFLESLNCSTQSRYTSLTQKQKLLVMPSSCDHAKGGVFVGRKDEIWSVSTDDVPETQAPTRLVRFDRIPTEIVQHIASLLPLSDSVALSVTSRGFIQLLGTGYLELLRNSDQDDGQRFVFRRKVFRMIFESLACPKYGTLHLLARSGGWSARLTDAERFERISALSCWVGYMRWPRVTWDGEWIYSDDDFPELHFSMALKMYRFGFMAAANSYLKYVSLQPKLRRMTFFPTYRGFVLHELRFVQDHLCKRTQYWIFIQKVPGLEISTFPMRNCTAMCHHLDANSKDGADRYALTLKCRFAHLGSGNDSCTFCEGLIHCAYCCTEAVVETKTDPKRGKAVVVTKWQVHGAGWELHKYWFQYTWSCVREAMGHRLPKSARDFFEGQPVVRHDVILEPGKAWDMMAKLCGSFSALHWESLPAHP